MKHLFLIIALFVFFGANAQKKLQKFYAKGEYVKCIQLADKYIDKKKYVSPSLLFKAQCLMQVRHAESDDGYKSPVAEAVKCLSKIRKKDSLYFAQESQTIGLITKIAQSTADSLKALDTKIGYREASKIYKHLNITYPEIAVFYFDIAFCKQKSESDYKPKSFFEEIKITEQLRDTLQQQKAVLLAYNFAKTAFDSTEFELAADYYDLICQFLPDKPKAYYHKAECYLNLNQPENFDAEMNTIWKLISRAPEDEVVGMYVFYTSFMFMTEQDKKLFKKIVEVKDTLSIEYHRYKKLMNEAILRIFEEQYKDSIVLERSSKESPLKRVEYVLKNKRAHPISNLAAVDEQNRTMLLFILKRIVGDFRHYTDLPFLFDVVKFKERYYADFPEFDNELKKVTYECRFSCGFSEAEKRQMLAEVNKRRSKRTICGDKVMPPASPLVWDDCVASAAQLHADEMVKYDFYSHPSPNGASPSDRGFLLGCDSLGENIADGYRSISAVVEGWITSPGHCQNIMNGDYTKFGAGRSENKWVQNFQR